jgi:hypothetical protein
MGDGIRANKNLKSVHVLGHLRCARRNGALARVGFHLFQRVFYRCHKVGTSTYCGIQKNNTVISKPELFAKLLFKELACEPDLQFNDLAGSVIDAIVITELSIIGREKIFVKIQPKVGLALKEFYRVQRFEGTLQ